MTNEKIYQVALTLVPGIGNVLIKHLVSYCGSAQGVFESSFSKLIKISGIGEKLARTVLKKNYFDEATKKIEKALKEDVSVLFFTDESYPSRFKEIIDSPALIYWKGNSNLNYSPMIAIVGTRNATDYGRSFLKKFIYDLLPLQPIIVSGLAYGIDVYAHQIALECQLPTIGVLAHGLDIVYPSSHHLISKKMVNQGGLLTEYSFGVKPERLNFPARNRLIAGLADAVVVVEASEKGGALITADLANGYNKDVFAVPGNVDQLYSQGCNNLIKSNRAHLLTNVDDLKQMMNWDETKEIIKKDMQLPSSLCSEEGTILALLNQNVNEMHIDEISLKSQIPIHKLSSFLLKLELEGLIKLMPGKKYKVSLK